MDRLMQYRTNVEVFMFQLWDLLYTETPYMLVWLISSSTIEYKPCLDLGCHLQSLSPLVVRLNRPLGSSSRLLNSSCFSQLASSKSYLVLLFHIISYMIKHLWSEMCMDIPQGDKCLHYSVNRQTFFDYTKRLAINRGQFSTPGSDSKRL